jgi:hypothetical protein
VTFPSPARAGQAASLTGSLTSWGRPLAGAAVRIFIDGRHAMTLQAGADGSLRYRFPRSLSAGTHAVQLTYHGSRPLGLAPAATGGAVTILPIDLTLQAIPAIAGVTFTLDGRVYVTDASGRVQTPIPAVGAHRVSVAPPADTESTRYRFAHWFGGPATPSLDLRVYDDRAITAALTGSFRVPVSFLDDSGSPVDPNRVSDVSAVGPAGSTDRLTSSNSLPPGGGGSERSIWLTVPAPSSAAQAASAASVRFALASARFEGVSVANRGDDRFSLAAGGPWVVRLRVYTLRVQVRKPLLGAATGEAVVRGGSGVQRSVKIDPRGFGVVRQLPRDLYTVSPGGTEVGPSTTVEVSRDKQVDLTLYTPAEAGVGLLGLALCGLALVGLPLLVQGRLAPVRRWLPGPVLRTPQDLLKSRSRPQASEAPVLGWPPYWPATSSPSRAGRAGPPGRAQRTGPRLVGAASAAAGLVELASETARQILNRRS